MLGQLLSTKLYTPSFRPDRVPRSHLIERLGRALERKLTLVSAPAGFGKTTLIAEWLAGAGRPCTWLSLDENDNDPARFSSYVLAALQKVDPDIGQAAQGMLRAPQPPPAEVFLTSLINDIADRSQPFVFVIDDYHLIHTLAIHQQLAFLLEHLPPSQQGIHVVIVTREDPPLPLSRWRARGQMAELRQADLSFTERETADFLRRVTQLDLSPVDVAALQRRTEGWIAGLQLVALSLRGRGDAHDLVQSFTGSHRYILDYLIEEVVQRQTADVRQFLLKTCILDHFCAALCDAVAQRSDSEQMLVSLDQANLFVVPLDQSRRWYRYHHLFADLLRQRLRTVGVPEPMALLHERASRWYQDHDLPADAVRHALVACDWERAATLILGVNDTILKSGEVVTLLGWLRALPDEVVRADPKLCNAFSWALILTERLDAAESYLARAEHLAGEQGGGDDAFLGGIAVAWAHIARARGDTPRAIALAEQALTLLPQDRLSERSVVNLNLGMAQWFSGRLGEAESALAEAERAAGRSGNDYVRYAALAFLSRAQAARGRLRQAWATGCQIVEQGEGVPITAVAHFDLARLHYEWNELAVAVEHLQKGLELSRRGGGLEFQFSGNTTLALVKQAQGAPYEAQAALQQADQLIDHPGISPGTRLYHRAVRALVALAQDDLAVATLALEGAPELEEAGSFPDYLLLMLARARLLLARGHRVAAHEQLVSLCEMASQAGWQWIARQALALQALTVPTPNAALASLSEVLPLAELEGYVRTFVDAGTEMAQLLERALSQGITPAYTRRLLAAFQASAPASPSSGVSRLIEPLSDRELEIVRLLATGQTNQEIAAALYISINTVKTHLTNIYGKLGVNNRRAAAARAEKLGILT